MSTTRDESSLLARFDALVESGIVLYDAAQATIEHVDAGLTFQFLLTSALANKPTFHTVQSELTDQPPRAGSDINTEGFELGDVGDTHFLAVNKFCFARPHLMLLTSDGHRKQFEALDEADLAAAWRVLHSMQGEYVVFFNCGRDSGCSRLHKHMQIMPKPVKSFASFLDSEDGEDPGVPFQWFYRRFVSTPESLTTIYSELLKEATHSTSDEPHGESLQTPADGAVPHNLIFTKKWMLVVPRRRAGVSQGAGANAMGMLGIIAVATQEEVKSWVTTGLSRSMAELGVRKGQ